MVVDDVLVFVPAAAAASVRSYAHENAYHRPSPGGELAAITVQVTALGKQVEDLQRALMGVGADAKAAQESIKELQEEEPQSVTEDLDPRLGRLDHQARTIRAIVGRLRDEQGATAAMVTEMRAEVAEMRAEVGGLRGEIRSSGRVEAGPAGRRVRLPGPVRRFLHRARRRWRERFDRVFGTTPKLGRLQHHPPIPLEVPDHYLNGRLPQEPPTISIVTPSYNQGHFLRRTIESVLSQDYPNLEYVVQDGDSDDETRMVLERYADRLHHWEMRKDDGQGHAINLGMGHTSGEIMAWLNSDDVLLPGSLRYVARYFAEHPNVDAIYGHRVLIDERDREIGRWVLPRHGDEILSWADFVPQETLFWRRRVWEEAGGEMNEDFRFALDWDLLLRFRDAGAKIVRVPRFLGGFRVHDDQKTNIDWDSAGETEMALIRTRELDREVTPAEIGQRLRWYLRRHVVLHKLYRAGVLRY
jgi:glycosyltransferase involved in cell wall biosynthesis